ncbi:MAG: type II secretion system minor pseudopilin GspK [Pseudomonadota bacterium]
MKRRQDEAGAALISVLLMVSIMAAIAVAMTDVGLRSLSRASIADERARVSWQITGAEEAGIVALNDLLEATQGELSVDNPSLAQPITFAAGGGSIVGQLEDATNCFNVNAMAGLGEVEDDVAEQPVAIRAYRDLLLSLELSEFEVEALTDALLDWLDADSTPRIAGAEDGYYLSQSPPYRTSGQPMVDVSELRSVLGYDAEVLEVLHPLLCVRDNTDLGPFNINTLDERHSPLLVMLLGGSINIQEAVDLLSRRPFGGWSQVDAFLATDTVSRIAPEIVRSDLMGTTARHLTFRGTAYFGNVSSDFETLYSIGEANIAQIARRNRSAR